MNDSVILNATAANVVMTPKTIAAAIVTVKVIPAESVYGAKTQNKEQRLVHLYLENAELNFKHDAYFTYYEGASLTDLTSMGKFIIKYGGIIQGSIINLEKNKNGFWRVLM